MTSTRRRHHRRRLFLATTTPPAPSPAQALTVHLSTRPLASPWSCRCHCLLSSSNFVDQTKPTKMAAATRMMSMHRLRATYQMRLHKHTRSQPPPPWRGLAISWITRTTPTVRRTRIRLHKTQKYMQCTRARVLAKNFQRDGGRGETPTPKKC